jgi:hypothetical protein
MKMEPAAGSWGMTGEGGSVGDGGKYAGGCGAGCTGGTGFLGRLVAAAVKPPDPVLIAQRHWPASTEERLTATAPSAKARIRTDFVFMIVIVFTLTVGSLEHSTCHPFSPRSTRTIRAGIVFMG